MHPSQNSAGPEQLNASKLKDANEKIDFSLSLQVLLVRYLQAELQHNDCVHFSFSGQKGHFCLTEWMNSHRACRGPLLRHFSHRYLFFFTPE